MRNNKMGIKFLSFLELLLALISFLSGIACSYVGYYFLGFFDYIVAGFLTWAVLFNMIKYIWSGKL